MNALSGPAPAPGPADRILLTVFSYLTTVELIKARAVHPYWRKLVRGMPETWWAALTDPAPRLLRRLHNTGTPVTILDISIINLEHFQAICGLLPLFLPTLVELSLYFYSRPGHAVAFPFEMLWDVLRSPAPELRSLCLKGDWLFETGAMPACNFLFRGGKGKLRTLVLGGFKPIAEDPKGYPVTAFGGVEVLDIAAHSLANVITTRSQYPALRELTVHNVGKKTMRLVLPSTARKVNIHFSARVWAVEAETWLRASALEKIHEVFATKGGRFLLGAFAGRNIIKLACIASGSIFKFSTYVDTQSSRTVLVAPEEVNDLLERLSGLGLLENVTCVSFEGLAAMQLLPAARLEQMPKLSILGLGISFQDIRAVGDDQFRFELFEGNALYALPRLNCVAKLVVRGKRGFGVTIDKERLFRFVEQVTPAMKTLQIHDISLIGDFEFQADIMIAAL